MMMMMKEEMMMMMMMNDETNDGINPLHHHRQLAGIHSLQHCYCLKTYIIGHDDDDDDDEN